MINEQDYLKNRKTKPLVNAITNRNPITFYYSGPKTPEKESVKPGVRVRAEAVALGLSKRGNLLIRAFVAPPSVSKKGFLKTGWRTFMVSRMSNVRILTEETFNIKRPGYKDGEESKSGPMSVTYVSTNWDELPSVKKPEEPLKITPDKPIDDKETLPQPKPQPKPTTEPEQPPIDGQTIDQQKDLAGIVFKNLETKINDIEGIKTIKTNDFQNSVKELYKLKQDDWVNSQKQIGGNTNPGSGTRRRFEITSYDELSKLLKNNNINISDKVEDITNTPTQEIQENIKRIKTLMLLLN